MKYRDTLKNHISRKYTLIKGINAKREKMLSEFMRYFAVPELDNLTVKELEGLHEDTIRKYNAILFVTLKDKK